MSIIGSNILAGSSGQGGGYEIEQSLRFDGSSKLSRASAFGNANASWTLSFWFKRSRPLTTTDGDSQVLVWSEPGGGDTNTGTIQFFYDSRYTATKTNRILSVWSDTTEMYTPGVQRDFSAWYHLVIKSAATSGTSGTVTYYLNGVEQVSNTVAEAYMFGPNRQPNIGARASSAYFSGYMAEFHYVHGTTKNYTDFGEFDDNGVWRPIEYTGGSYGANGFYLKFDPSATNGIGHDHSGNGNNWTASGFTTSGTGTDVMSDTPTTNYPTWNALERGDDPATSMGVDLSEGNLVAAMNRDVGDGAWVANFTVPTSGKWYWEVEQLTAGSPNPFITTGIIAYPWTWNSSDHVRYDSRGRIGKDWNDVTYQSVSAWGAGYGSASDVCGVAVDADNNTVQFYKNGTSQGTTESYSGSTYTYVPHCTTAANTAQNVRYNFGQRAFAYTPPTGYKALNTANLPAPDIADGSEYFNTVLYTGNGSTQSITGVGFQPDFTWIKKRASTGNHMLTDVVRGPNTEINSNTQNAESSNTNALTSFNSDGFSVGSDGAVNINNEGLVAWNWLAGGSGSSNTSGSITSTVSVNPSAGFSIVTWNGSTANGTVGHGLGVAPSLIIFKRRNATTSWPVYHSAISPSNVVYLNETAGQVSSGNSFGSTPTAPTSTVFSVGDKGDTNYGDMLAYCFAEVESYSKIGSYTGNGSSDGPFVALSFVPAFILIKSTGGDTNWTIIDSARSTYNPAEAYLKPNASQAETNLLDIDMLSNGFKLRGTSGGDHNQSGTTFIYAAFAENPFGGSGVSPATAR